jgi:hypothetical protein
VYYARVLSLAVPFAGGHSALTAMLILVSQGRLRPHPSWMDRLGFALGIGWVALLMLGWFCTFVV